LNAAAANRALAWEVLAALHRAGVKTLCVCPGARNAPLVLAAEAAATRFDRISFFEERSASFFALGRSRRDGGPVAIITTSGTAAAELLPAMLEAVHAGWPLIAVTADRPRRLRGTGAPQTIDQPSLFISCGIPVIDLDEPSQLGALPPGPMHLNVCFEEPLVDDEPFALPSDEMQAEPSSGTWMDESEALAVWKDFFGRVRNPLVLVSSLTAEEARSVAPWLASLSSPMHLEAVSQLRSHRNLQEFGLHAGERILLTPECREVCDGFLRIGGVPTSRLWRELDTDERPILHVARTNFRGLARRSPVIPLTHFRWLAGKNAPSGGDNDALLARDRACAEALCRFLEEEPCSEASLVRAASHHFPSNARVMLGNSLPLREWDLAASREAEDRIFFANRGVNGIDGLVSTTLGLAGPDRPTAALLGDLSALYDLAGLWPAAQLAGTDITIAVMNNGGGKIFDPMFGHHAFLNTHDLRLQGWAEMFGWHYGIVRDPQDPWPEGRPRLVEILPEPQATRRLAEKYAALWC